MVGVQVHGALCWLAVGQAHGSRLDPMVDGVAHQVGQRVADAFHHGLVQLGVLTTDVQGDVLAQLACHVVHDALEPVEAAADFHHAQLQRMVADLLDQRGDGGGGFQHLAVAQLACHFGGAGRCGDQFPDQVDELLQLVGIDPEAGVLALAGVCRACRRAGKGFCGWHHVDLGKIQPGVAGGGMGQCSCGGLVAISAVLRTGL